ncbi:MAG: DNA polymerase II large subunit [Thermoplasmata archaeon]
MESYFAAIEASVDRAYEVATQARRQGLDPAPIPEIPRAQDMAMRVEKLLQEFDLDGLSREIRALASRMPREEVAIAIARRLATDPNRKGGTAQRVETALRVGLAILTEGILVAPLEGLAEVHLRPDRGGEYIELSYAGPIRAAGGTAQALSVLLADIVRQELGIAAYRPDRAEVERYQEEIPLYKHFQHLQYVPTAEEIGTVVRNIPVCISGESTEGDAEVSAFRNLPRVGTNGIRGGACLVIAEGLCQKAAKLRKIVDKLQHPGWEFLAELGHGTKAVEDQSTPKYLAESVGGRPVLAHPNRPGGFRLVYGRARTGGLASCSVNPATMILLDRFVAVGTQVKLEYPGKASAMSLCDTVEGPIVVLHDGTVTAVHDAESAEALAPHVARIVDLGELLVPFGEFLENNRPLAPGAYSIDWHLAELEAAGAPIEAAFPSGYAEAVETARRHGVPLPPRFLLFWHDLTGPEIRALAEFVERAGRWTEDRLHLPDDPSWREPLERLGFLSRPSEGERIGTPDSSAALVGGVGLRVDSGALLRHRPLDPVAADPLEYVSRLAGVRVKARAPSRIGARIGRPEKAHQRIMRPNVHVLFPLGESGGDRRSIPTAARAPGPGPRLELGVRRCPACEKHTIWGRCACGHPTEPTGETSFQELPVGPLWMAALERLGLRVAPEVKGVKGLTSPGKTPELLEKGILRAAHGISVYQDGTARFDLTDLPLTHFRPAEVGSPIEALRRLGYATDWQGEPLTDPHQLVELRPQDLIVSRSCGEYLLQLAQFVDDELVRIYRLPPFYRARRIADLLGAIVVGLAPHTSGGVAGRIVGFSAAEACLAPPVFHAAKRRNCDGDEDSVTLLLDPLLNFSRSFLPSSRGALMDKPLVLTTRVDPTEVDGEARNVDVGRRYPLALYRAAEARQAPKEVEPLIDLVAHRIGGPHALSGYGFTHDTTDLAGGPVQSAYRRAGSMDRMVAESMGLAAKIRAVDLAEAIGLLLNTHFLPDVMGNLKSYATQKFICKVCRESYRRPPLALRCSARGRDGTPCGGELLPTVYEASVRKYVPLTQRLSATPGVSPYVRQRIQILSDSLSSMFPADSVQTTLETVPAAPARADAAPR